MLKMDTLELVIVKIIHPLLPQLIGQEMDNSFNQAVVHMNIYSIMHLQDNKFQVLLIRI